MKHLFCKKTRITILHTNLKSLFKYVYTYTVIYLLQAKNIDSKRYPLSTAKPKTRNPPQLYYIYNVRRNVFPFLFFHFFHPCAFYGSHEESPPTGHPFVRAEVYTWLHLRVRKPEAVDWSKHARAHFYPRINIPARHVYIGIHTGTWHRGKTTHQPIRQT